MLDPDPDQMNTDPKHWNFTINTKISLKVGHETDHYNRTYALWNFMFFHEVVLWLQTVIGKIFTTYPDKQDWQTLQIYMAKWKWNEMKFLNFFNLMGKTFRTDLLFAKQDICHLLCIINRSYHNDHPVLNYIILSAQVCVLSPV